MKKSKMYINENGCKIWYLLSKGKTFRHRVNGPAIEWRDGSKWWCIDNKLHRLDCQLCSCSKADGRCVCVHHIHSNGPAIEQRNGRKEWWINNKRHRIDGPAIVRVDGTKEWWIEHIKLPTKEVESWIEENKIDLKTVEGQLAFKLSWIY